MANTLTDLIPDAYAAMDVVSRELAGFIPSVARSSTAERLAKGQTLHSFATRANSAGGDITEAMALPTRADQTVDNKDMVIDK